jgi:ankyrin repeat protein
MKTPCKNGQVRDRKTKLCRERLKPGKKCKTQKKCSLYKLHQACRDAGSKGKVDLRSLMTKSEDINQLDNTDMTPLMILASQGNVEMIDLFVLNNANLLETNHKDETVLHYANEAAMKKLLTYPSVPINGISTSYKTAIHHAIEINSPLSVKLLLQRGHPLLEFHDTELGENDTEVQFAMKTAVRTKKYTILKTLLPYLDKHMLREAHTEAVHHSENNENPNEHTEYKKIATMIKKVYEAKFHTNI